MTFLRVGLDLDGVVYDFDAHARAALREVYGEDPGPGPSQKWDAIKHSVSRDAWHWLWSDGAVRHLWSGPPLPNAVTGVRELQAIAEVTPITGRPLNACLQTSRLMRELDLPTAVYVPMLAEKALHDFDVWIEDAPEAIEALFRAGKKVIIFDRPWNRDTLSHLSIHPVGVYRAATWDDVLEIVRGLVVPGVTSIGRTFIPLPSEVRIVDPDTGAAKGRKPERFELLPVRPLEEIARVFGFGSSKYDDRNWEHGYDWSLSYGALQRHLHAFWRGEDTDAESGLPHMAHAGFHVLALLEFMQTNRDKDDRSR